MRGDIVITLYIANNIADAAFSNYALSIPEDIHIHLKEHKLEYSYLDIDLITDLSLYGTEKVFSQTELLALINFSEEMTQSTWKNPFKDLNTFFINLMFFCDKALKQNKLIVAIGD